MVMTRWLSPVLLAGLWLTSAGWTVGQESLREKPKELPAPSAVQPAAPPACEAPCLTPECCIPVNKLYLINEQRETTLPRIAIREEVSLQKVPALEEHYKEEKRTVVVMVERKRDVEQPVTCMTTVTETQVDPCTGKCCTVERQVPVVKMIKTTVYDTVPEERTVIIKVPEFKTVERVMEVRRLVALPISVPAIESRIRLETAPGEVVLPERPCPTPACLPHVPH
jgi:hypothetical protein